MLYQELEKEVARGDLARARHILSQDSNHGHLSAWHKGQLLHVTSSVEFTKELLLSGANVDASNCYRETPLHTAITKYKELELVRELLKHGATVNATNRKGNTPLNHAVKQRRKDLSVVKELLEYGSNVNIKNREQRLYDNHFSSLDNSMSDLNCAKLLIQITLLNNFDSNYKCIINLDPYKHLSYYKELSLFLEHCTFEITQMRKHKINKNLSLHDFVTSKKSNPEVLYTNIEGVKTITDEVCVLLRSTSYHIYHDVITTKIKSGLERECLLSKLSYLKLYTESKVSNQVKDKKIVLDCYSASGITKYLSNDDLFNLLIVFYKHPNESSGSSDKPIELKNTQRLDDTLNGSCTKRARLELSC